MVCLAPNCFAKTLAVIFIVSEEVTPINKSEVLIRASLSVAIEVASPLITLISKWVLA